MREVWVEEGHELIGRCVVRSFAAAGAVVGRLCARLPVGSAENEEELFKVVHADGDVEELEAYEAYEAAAAYDKHKNHAGIVPPRQSKASEQPDTVLRQPKYVNTLARRLAQRGASAAVRWAASRHPRGLCALEEAMAPWLNV